MGFRIPSRTEIVLEFPEDDPVLGALHGATVRCRSRSLADAEEFDKLEGDERTLTLVNDVIIEWDLLDEQGNRVPLSLDGIKRLPAWVPSVIWRGWFRGLLTPPSPLLQSSANGASPTR